MRNLKRGLSLILSIAFVLSLCTVGAFAGSPPPEPPAGESPAAGAPAETPAEAPAEAAAGPELVIVEVTTDTTTSTSAATHVTAVTYTDASARIGRKQNPTKWASL